MLIMYCLSNTSRYSAENLEILGPFSIHFGNAVRMESAKRPLGTLKMG